MSICHLAKIRWQDNEWNTDVSSLTDLGPCWIQLSVIAVQSLDICQTSEGHTCPPSFAVPLQYVTRLPASARSTLEAMSRLLSEQVA